MDFLKQILLKETRILIWISLFFENSSYSFFELANDG